MLSPGPSSIVTYQTAVTPGESSSSYELLKFPNSKGRTVHEAELTAISASCGKVAVLTLNTFWVFNTNPLLLACAGHFQKKVFKFAQKEGDLRPQLPAANEINVCEFSCVAVDDNYLAIGVSGRVMAFIVTGNHAGVWVVNHEIKGALVEKLQFTRCAQLLLALVRTTEKQKKYEKILVYSTKDFPQTDLERAQVVTLEPLEIQWTADTTRTSKGMTISRDRTMVAIYTNFCESTAVIRLLTLADGLRWENWGFHSVQA